MAGHELRSNSLPRPVQITIFAALIVCAAFAFYTRHMKGLSTERDLIQTEIEKLELSVSKETDIENQLNFCSQELARLQNQFDELKSILSMEKEMPEILGYIQQMAASSNLKISRLTPVPLVRRTFCSDWPIRIEAAGNFDALGLFFEKLGRATKAINVGDISIKAADNPTDAAQTLTAGFIATVFVFREELAETPEDNEAPKNFLTETGGAIQR
jgi:Tfp pilus assembly protein PilO